MEDTQLAAVTDLVNDILSGSPVPQAHSADFINLPKKLPHGPIANGRPLTNLAMVWKLTAALLKDHYQPRLLASGILPPYQLWMCPHCSSVELLHVLHDAWWDRWRQRLEAWVLSDDVRHAYGSINHNTECAVLTAAGVSAADAATVQRHDLTLEVHMGGADGRSPSSTYVGAGTGQGCTVSGIQSSICGEVQGREACCHVPAAETPAGPLNRVLLMDVTQWLPGDRSHLPTAPTSSGRRVRQLPHRLHPAPEPRQPPGPSVHAPRATDCPLALPPLTAVPHPRARAPVCYPPHGSRPICHPMPPLRHLHPLVGGYLPPNEHLPDHAPHVMALSSPGLEA